MSDAFHWVTQHGRRTKVGGPRPVRVIVPGCVKNAYDCTDDELNEAYVILERTAVELSDRMSKTKNEQFQRRLASKAQELTVKTRAVERLMRERGML